jgi:hypothetical protein
MNPTKCSGPKLDNSFWSVCWNDANDMALKSYEEASTFLYRISFQIPNYLEVILKRLPDILSYRQQMFFYRSY